VAGVAAAGDELPVDAVGGLAPCRVGVGSDDDAGRRGCLVAGVAGGRGRQVRAQRVGLGVGERGPERRDADRVPVGGQGDSKGVQRSLDQDGGRLSRSWWNLRWRSPA